MIIRNLMMRLRHTGICAVYVVASMTASIAHAEVAATDASAKVYRPINFAVLLELDFGSIVAGPAGGTVTLNPASAIRDCAGGSLVCAGTFSWSKLQLTGSDATVVVTYSPDFTLTGPGAPILAELDFPGGSGTAVALSGGSTTIDIGAKLHVNANQVSGTYSGIFSVDVNYQ
jgi:Mat/Ecp fimbriae major subunit